MTIDYAAIKLVHQTAVVLSLTGFLIRGAASLAGARWLASPAARSVPHVVDTVLLLSALVLAWMLRLSPGNAPWLIAKIVGLGFYIGLGMLAMRPARPMVVRVAAWLAALATAAWIVSVALTKNPWGFAAYAVERLS